MGGTEADDFIAIDFVTEPGLLRDHHLMTRRTNNNGNYSFAAHVRLDFGAVDEDGTPVWDLDDTISTLSHLVGRDVVQDVSMLKAVKNGIAMGNGCPEAKAAAVHVTTAVDDDGVRNALRHFGLL